MNYTWADVTKKSLNTCGVRYFIPGSLQQVTQICFRHKLSHNKGTLFCFETEKQIIQRRVISLKTPVSARSHARAERYLPEIWFHTNPPSQQEGGKPVSTYSSSVNYHKWTSNTHTHTHNLVFHGRRHQWRHLEKCNCVTWPSNLSSAWPIKLLLSLHLVDEDAEIIQFLFHLYVNPILYS